MARRLRIGISGVSVFGLLVCAVVMAGCGDGENANRATRAENTTHAENATRAEHANRAPNERGSKAQAAAYANQQDYAGADHVNREDDAVTGHVVTGHAARQSEAMEAAAAIAAQRLTQNLVAAKSLYRVTVVPSDSLGEVSILQPTASLQSPASAPAEDFRARIVVVEVSPEAESLPIPEQLRARAAAFGLEWAKRNYLETQDMIHCKSEVRGCSVSKGSNRHGGDMDARVTMTRSAQAGGPYSMTLEYLGSREGKDHYLLTATIEERTPTRPAGAPADEAPAPPANRTLSASVKATPDLLQARFEFDPQDPFAQIRTSTYADGRVETIRTRRVTYELVYSGEPFYLKLANRVLLCFGSQGIARYTPEEHAAMAQGHAGIYRECPNCTLSDAMAVGEIRLLASASQQVALAPH